MALKDDIAILSLVPVFAGLDTDHLRLLAFGAERRPLDDGQILFRQKSAADCAFVVARGALRLTSHGRDGSETDMGLAGPGTMLTEMAMITPTERRLTATAEGRSEVLRITRALFHRMVEEYPDVGRMTEALLRQRFSEMTGRLTALAGKL